MCALWQHLIFVFSLAQRPRMSFSGSHASLGFLCKFSIRLFDLFLIECAAFVNIKRKTECIGCNRYRQIQKKKWRDSTC